MKKRNSQLLENRQEIQIISDIFWFSLLLLRDVHVVVVVVEIWIISVRTEDGAIPSLYSPLYRKTNIKIVHQGIGFTESVLYVTILSIPFF